jgi:hypothetical protein
VKVLMNLHNIIFSKTSPQKYYRHIIFWSGIYVFFSFSMSIYKFSDHFSWENFLLPFFTIDGYKFTSFIMDIVFTYIVAYRLLPRFFAKKKYLEFIAWIIALTILTYVMEGVMFVWYFNALKFTGSSLWFQTWSHTQGFLTSGLVGKCGLFLVFKMLKSYYEKMEEKVILVRETANAELQLLKAQVHPHFLFNTLNNIYSFTMNKSPLAGELVLKLSATLNYMVNDCEAPSVPVEKELKMVEDYIGLEKVRYGDRLDMTLEIKGDYQNKMIAPLLLIPFVENSFKHGSSKMLQHPWIKLKIVIKENVLYMDLNNSKPFQFALQNGKSGIGLKNVQKRLELLYPNRHDLVIRSIDEEFSIHLQIALEQTHVMVPAEKQKQIVQESQSFSYAQEKNNLPVGR